MTHRFVAPPNWPQPPPGWHPPDGWQPAPDWGPAPAGWQFWVDDPQSAAPPEPRSDGSAAEISHQQPEVKVSLFGAKNRVRELAAEADRLRGDLERLGALGVTELERRRSQLRQEIADQEQEFRRGQTEQTELLERQRVQTQAAHRQELTTVLEHVEHAKRRLAELSAAVVATEDVAILQEVGLYEARHPLTDAAAYQAELARLQQAKKIMARKDGGAVEAATDWTVNGSAAKGRSMIGDYTKLMLRAYNAEVDNLVRAMKPYKLQTSIERLDRVAQTIERLGRTMSIRISGAYHTLCIEELELTADHIDKVATDKERAREERERLREERKVEQEIEAERRRLAKEQSHYRNALDAMLANGDQEGAERLRAQLADIDRAIADVDYRAANIRAGYVYVISNIGAFGDGMIKIGMTRRLDPLDRVRELGDASVPFKYDVHALHFSADAVGIETAMHNRLSDRRVNRVNPRREFFYATPDEARRHLLELAGDLLEFTEVPEAIEFRQSRTLTELVTGASPSSVA